MLLKKGNLDIYLKGNYLINIYKFHNIPKKPKNYII